MPFDTPVRQHMSGAVVCIDEHASLDEARAMMARHDCSTLPVLSPRQGGPIGVIARTDLLRVGRTRAGVSGRRGTSSLPPEPVGAYMTVGVDSVDPDTSLAAAAARMVRERRRRLYVLDGDRVAGVIGVVEVLEAIAAARVLVPIADIASTQVETLEAHEPLARAVERLELAHVHGVVITDAHWPVGMFTQEDALAARDARPNDHVELWMDPSISMVPMWMPAHRAADMALHTRPRRLLTFDSSQMRGIVSGLDFARLIAAA